MTTAITGFYPFFNRWACWKCYPSWYSRTIL